MKNKDIIIVLILSWLSGFIISYLHWGKKISW